MSEGMWITGRHSKEEMDLLQSLIQIAAGKAMKGELPYSYRSKKITFRAWIVEKALHVYYSWNYPPKEYWFQETKSNKECVNCLPGGPQGSAAREAWCEHANYNFPKCPYGVPTPSKLRIKVSSGCQYFD